MGTPDMEHLGDPGARPRVSVEELLAAKNTQPIRSLDDLTAETFESDEGLEEFLAFTYAERHRDTPFLPHHNRRCLGWGAFVLRTAPA